jgi:hypothetical protein
VVDNPGLYVVSAWTGSPSNVIDIINRAGKPIRHIIHNAISIDVDAKEDLIRCDMPYNQESVPLANIAYRCATGQHWFEGHHFQGHILKKCPRCGKDMHGWPT